MEMKSESLLDLAIRLEAQLRRSGATSGNRCPPTAELARGLRVSTRTANNALRILVKRGVLMRRQRVGTVLTERTLAEGASKLQRVHLMVHADFLRTEGLLADDVVIGLQESLPGAQLRYDFIPAANVTESVKRIVAEALRQPEPEGFVMVRAPLEVQRLIQTSGLPAVVYGHLQPSVTGLPQIDWDHRQMADLAVEHLLQKGCRRFAVLLRRDFGAGDAVFLDRFQEKLADVNVGLKDLTVRGLPHDVEAVVQALKPLIGDASRPLGIICRSRPLADGVQRAIEAADPYEDAEERDIIIVVRGTEGKAGRAPSARVEADRAARRKFAVLWERRCAGPVPPRSATRRFQAGSPRIRSIRTRGRGRPSPRGGSSWRSARFRPDMALREEHRRAGPASGRRHASL